MQSRPRVTDFTWVFEQWAILINSVSGGQNLALCIIVKKVLELGSSIVEILGSISFSIRNDVFKISEVCLYYILRYNIKCVHNIIFTFGVQFPARGYSSIAKIQVILQISHNKIIKG